jgi:hypothetical protein
LESRVAGLSLLAQSINWQQPWLAPWRGEANTIETQLAGGASVAEVLNALHHQSASGAATARLRPNFVPQAALPAGQAYEQFIFDTHQVPTRENLHDLFNGLCWLRFPQTKRRLNALQATQIAEAGVQPLRGAVRDALTVFDENAALLSAPQPLWDALQARQWHRLFIDLRPLWRQASLVLFGHALLEKLAHPRKPITAHVYRAQAPAGPLPALDRWLAHDLSAALLAGKPFVPLPVLGVPGWWPENEAFSFYDDVHVFRPSPAA